MPFFSCLGSFTPFLTGSAFRSFGTQPTRCRRVVQPGRSDFQGSVPLEKETAPRGTTACIQIYALAWSGLTFFKCWRQSNSDSERHLSLSRCSLSPLDAACSGRLAAVCNGEQSSADSSLHLPHAPFDSGWRMTCPCSTAAPSLKRFRRDIRCGRFRRRTARGAILGSSQIGWTAHNMTEPKTVIHTLASPCVLY